MAALARAIDPGPVPPLSSNPPPVLVEAFKDAGGEGLSEEQLATQVTALAHGLTQNTTLTEQDLGRVLALAYLGGLLERRLENCDVACLGRAEQAYAALDIPWMAEPDAFMGQLLALSSLMQRSVPEEQGRAVLDYMRGIFGRAPLRHRYVAVRILRRAPLSESATATLRNLALRAERDSDYRLAVQLREAVLQRTTPGFADLAWLASACILAERLPCVERTIERARAARDADPARIAGLETQLRTSRRIALLARARGFEQRLERAHLLVDVGRRRDAIAEFDALRASRPRDARPVVGRARTWFDETMSSKASDLVIEARELDHKDRYFYELAVGLTFQRLMGMVSSGSDQLGKGVIEHLPGLRGDVDGLARFVPGVGGVLQIVVARLQEGVELLELNDPAERRVRLSAITRAALADAMALRERHPREPDVYRLIFLAARFGSAARDYAAASTAIPAGVDQRDDLLLMQAGLLYSLAVSWRDGERAADIARALDALSPASAAGQPARLLRVDTMVLEARLLGRTALWPKIAAAYRELAPDAAQEDRARIQNNLGVALWETGDHDGARAAWAEAITGGDAHGVAQLNSTVSSDKPDLDLLDRIADNSDRIGVRAQAVRWKVARARLKGAARRTALARAAEILATSSVDDAADGSAGVVLEESFNVGVGYSSRDRLLVKLYLGRAASLLLPAPAVDEPRMHKTKKKRGKRRRR
jgi:tetratricopeptide (TPR) repeat protein